MSQRLWLVVAGAMLATGPTWADGFNGLVEADYSHTDVSGGGSGNQWGGAASAETSLGFMGFNVQLDGGYHEFAALHHNVTNWDVGGDLFWKDRAGRFGLTAGYTDYTCCGSSIHGEHYGAFGEWFATPWITVGVKGGGDSANFGISGEYAGGEVEGYVLRDIGLSGMIDYTSIGHGLHETDYTAQAEWLVSERMPVGLYGGYTHSELSFHPATSANTFFVGLKLYLNSGNTMTLADRQRSGDVQWGSRFSALAFNF